MRDGLKVRNAFCGMRHWLNPRPQCSAFHDDLGLRNVFVRIVCERRLVRLMMLIVHICIRWHVRHDDLLFQPWMRVRALCFAYTFLLCAEWWLCCFWNNQKRVVLYMYLPRRRIMACCFKRRWKVSCGLHASWAEKVLLYDHLLSLQKARLLELIRLWVYAWESKSFSILLSKSSGAII